MKFKLLGKSGLRVSELCLGTMTFGLEAAWGTPKEECRKILRAFVEAGGNFIDTAVSYGQSEEYLGQMLEGLRPYTVIASKYAATIKGDDVNGSGSHRKNLIRSVELSLKRLRTDYLDLLWVHAWDFLTPVEEVMRALDDMVCQGKVLYTGVSNAPAWVIARSNTIAELKSFSPFVGLQVEYNLIERDAERELLPMARELDIGVTSWAPLAAGWLTGKYLNAGRQSAEVDGREPNRLDDRFAGRFVQRSERNYSIAHEAAAIAEQLGCPPSHVALNWVRRKGIIPVFGARTLDQAEENLRCLNTTLEQQHIRQLDEASKISLGYPHDFLARARPFIYGGVYDSIINHRAKSSI